MARNGSLAGTTAGVALSERWLRWLSNTLMASVYPGAPFARTFMAVELLNSLLEAFGDLIVPGQVRRGTYM